MSKREELEARLSIVEASIDGAEFGSPDLSTGWTTTNPKLGYLRVYCRDLRAALVELDASESIVNTDKARGYCRELRAVLLELNTSATLPFRCDQPSCAVLRSPRTACWLIFLEGIVGAPRQLETSSDSSDGVRAPVPGEAVLRPDPSAQETRPEAAHAGLPLLRQAISLLALVLAYLLYFHIDVRLQILKLISIFL